MSVCLILPAYNEGSVIGDVISDVKHALKNSPFDVEILVIDDGSKDTTAENARRSGAQVISHIVNSGCGAATATGLVYAQRAGFSIAATMDADGQHHPDDVMKGLELIRDRDCDLLLGSRLIDSTGMSDIKVLGNKGISLITHLLFGVNVTDSQSGLRVFSDKALQVLRWRSNGYEFCSEMLWRAKQQKLKVEEYPIKAIYTEYSKSKGQNNWNGLNIVSTLARHRLLELLTNE